ncbi:hypothetical protein NE237_004736 [Protea cynaroides]|uniref:Uncharacterized protein n=1 Tax=Protea cynaroides TaxID=273540 RepID=A0A9Q0QTW3_9MAGN|nr:hypothetical protein NE237_004736 [Protea cynaroides]
MATPSSVYLKLLGMGTKIGRNNVAHAKELNNAGLKSLRFNNENITETVIKVDFATNPFKSILTFSVIVATGIVLCGVFLPRVPVVVAESFKRFAPMTHYEDGSVDFWNGAGSEISEGRRCEQKCGSSSEPLSRV